MTEIEKDMRKNRTFEIKERKTNCLDSSMCVERLLILDIL